MKAKVSLSRVCQFSSLFVSALDANKTGLSRPDSSRWDRTQPIPVSEASVLSSKGLLKLGNCSRTSLEVNVHFRSLKAAPLSMVHMNFDFPVNWLRTGARC